MENEGLVGLLVLPISLSIAIFKALVQLFGFHLGAAIIILLAVVIFDTLKFFLIIINAIISKKPEGTGILDSIYYAIGHGHDSKGEIAFGIVVLVIGVALIYFSPEIVESPDMQEMITENPLASIGSLLAGVGAVVFYIGIKELVKTLVFGSWSFEDPELKHIKSEMMSAFKQGRTLDAINLFKMDLKSLNVQFMEADAIKLSFKKEEDQIKKIMSVFEKAEGCCKEGNIKKADAEVNTAKRMYDGLRPMITKKLRHYKQIKKTISILNKESKEIEDSFKKCFRNKLDVKIEHGCYKRLDMNKTLLSSESFWRSDNFKEAMIDLERLSGEFKQINDSLNDKLREQNELLSRKFPCLRCGKNMNMTNETCPACSTKPSESILSVMKELIGKLEIAAKKIADAKWLIDFDGEEGGFEDIQIALDNITKQIENGEFDRATSLLMSTKASQEALVSEVNEKLKIYEELSGKLSVAKKKTIDVGALLEQNKQAGIDVGEEEGMYASAKENSSLSALEGICKNGAFSDANKRLEKSLSEYERILSMLGKKMERYKNLLMIMSDIEESYNKTIELLENSKTKHIEVSIEERDLKAISLEGLRKISKTLSKEAEAKLNERLSSVRRIKESLSKKVEMFNRLKNMGDVLTERMEELRGLISKGVALKLNVKEEHEKFYGIKVDRIKTLLESCEDIVSLKKELDSALDTTQWCIASLSDKLSSVDDAPKWADAVDSAMKDNDMMDISSLRSIPEEWRGWSVDRYIESHPNDAFVISKSILIKTMSMERKRGYEEILSTMLNSGKIKSCGVFDERGIIMASEFPNMKDVNSLGEPVASILENAKLLAKWADLGGRRQIVIGAEEFKVVINELGDGLFLLCSIKPRENVGFLSIIISKGMKSLREISG
ncbi:MAG: hypothetical protein ABIG39_02180 [Candidatus Micrarchaeota archaeon]